MTLTLFDLISEVPAATQSIVTAADTVGVEAQKRTQQR